MNAASPPEVPGYELEGLLGRGGMGLVYKALEVELGRHVALKLIVPELASEERFRHRFLRESRLAASLDHPNVIPIYTAGEASGLLYLSMRYVEGSDLRTLLDRERTLETRRALAVVSQLAGALDTAHQRGLVHRDVKPSNVLLDKDGHVYLSDFGLSKRLATAEATHTGQFVGTLDYLAPEQIRGEPLDGRTDQYALACLFYECLTGSPPFRRETEAETLWAHMQEPPPPLAAHPELEPVLARALAKDVSERYETCTDFAAAAGAPPTAHAIRRRKLSPPNRRRALARPTRSLKAAAAGLVFAGTATGLILAFGQSSGGVRIVPDSVAAIDPASGHAVADVPLGRSPAGIAAGSGRIWILSRNGRTVTAVAPTKSGAVQTVDLRGTMTRQWAGGGTRDGATDFVAASDSNTLNVVTLALGANSGVDVTSVARITPWTPTPGDHGCSAYVTGSGTTVWFSRGRRLARIDALTGLVLHTRELPAATDAGNTCYGVRYTGGSLLASRSPDASIGYLDPGTGAFKPIVTGFPGITARESAPHAAAWAAGFNSLWIDVNGTLIDVDAKTGKIVARIPVGTGGGSVVVDPSSGVWVLDASGRALFRIDPATRRVSNRIGLGRRACCIAAGFRRIWVTLGPSRPS